MGGEKKLQQPQGGRRGGGIMATAGPLIFISLFIESPSALQAGQGGGTAGGGRRR